MTATRRKPTRRKQLGLTLDAYDELLAAQDGHCALCPAVPKTRRLDTDHDHRTGKVRGLLCHRCNRALPTWVSPAWLRAAADYLDRHRVVQMRVDGATWDEVAEAIGVTPETAYSRYSPLIRYERRVPDHQEQT